MAQAVQNTMAYAANHNNNMENAALAQFSMNRL